MADAFAGSGDAGLRGADDLFNERVRFFQDFLDRDVRILSKDIKYGDNIYRQKVKEMVMKGQKRLIININHIRDYNIDYAKGIQESPIDYIPAFDKALKDVVLALEAGELQQIAIQSGQRLEDMSFYVGFEGSFGENFLSPRFVTARHLGKLICLEGIVTRCSLVRAKVARSVHYSEKTKLFISREYRDYTTLTPGLPTPPIYPQEDDDGNPLTTEYGFSVYRDCQTLTLQEMPERSPAGQMPRPIDIVMNEDLVDQVKPGDRVQIVGVYRTLNKGGSTTATFRTALIANFIRHKNQEIQKPKLEETDVSNIKKIGKRRDVFDLLSSSLAPSIFGHDMIKKAILLVLLGGMEKNLANGGHIRGDINMLMIGDPSTAKSQLLRFVLNTAPLAIATTGRGSSGVGLTAAVTQDKETGERTLEAGAMVLADRGVVCIDEFDKMSDIDRVAIHEVMEQQTVTIAKAGIHTSLNARCSVVAAANPAYGQYDNEKSPQANIQLPDSLLSRFDLLFIVLDNMSDEHNRLISEHILRMHRYVPPGVEEGTPVPDSNIAGQFSLSTDAQEEHGSTDVFTKFNKLLHLGIKTKRSGKVELLSLGFLKKYIHYAKTHIQPVLTEEASKNICEIYGKLRIERDGREEKYRTVPITARTLETMIRLSTAHAKARLSNRVEKSDTEVARRILEFALYQKVEKKNRNKKLRTDGSSDDDEAGSDDDDGHSMLPSATPRSRSRRSAPATPASTRVPDNLARQFSRLATQNDEIDMDDLEEVPLKSSRRGTQSTASFGSAEIGASTEPMLSGSSLDATMADATFGESIDDERYDFFREQFKPLFLRLTQASQDSIAISDIVTQLNASLPMSKHFDASEVIAAIKRMSQDVTSIMYDSESEHLIIVS
ncbi:MCM DNA helicase complex subunit [Chytridiales sp. JEL 0842]|nr:MCM DNA helicase complex subunit [Chytridiales sp. JEL 0842]